MNAPQGMPPEFQPPAPMPDADTAATRRAETATWVNSLDPAATAALVARVKEVQGWVDGYAKTLGRRRAPTVRVSLDVLYYAPLRNRIVVPVRTMLQAPERLLRIAVAHECGHFKRRWVSLLARSDLARLHEEVLADRVAIQLTGATLDEFDAAVREIAKFEHDWDEASIDAYLGLRRAMLQQTHCATGNAQ